MATCGDWLTRGLLFSALVLVTFVFFFHLFYLGPQVQHVEVPSLGVKSELQLLVCATATAMRDPKP